VDLKMIKLWLIVLGILLLASGTCYGQQPARPRSTPDAGATQMTSAQTPVAAPDPYAIPGCEKGLDTCVDGLKLKLKQSQTINAQILMNQAQAAYNAALQDLESEGQRIKTDDHLPADAVFDPGTLMYRPAPKPQPAPTAPPVPLPPHANATPAAPANPNKPAAK
jgi:hypothetical protein